jgi:hypothetical protein
MTTTQITHTNFIDFISNYYQKDLINSNDKTIYEI